jgi:hypothetical protein
MDTAGMDTDGLQAHHRPVADVVQWEVELEEARECCYRPEASVATVEAYLAALERMRVEHPAPVGQVDVDVPVRRPPVVFRLRGLRVSVGAVAVIAAAAAVGLHAGPPAPTAPIARPTSSDRLDAIDALPQGGALLATVTSAGPRATGLLDAGGRTVVLSSACRGTGTYDVRIGSAPAVTLVCDHEGPSFAMLSSDHPLHRFVVTGSPGQGRTHWVVAVGTLDDAGLRTP